MEISKSKISALVLVLILVLSLLLTACGNGGDTSAAGNSAPGTSARADSANTPDTSAPTSADNTVGSRYDFTKLSQFIPQLKTPSMDISKYFSANGTEFDIVQCAKDLGFDDYYMKSMNLSFVKPENVLQFLEERAYFPLHFYYNGTNENYRMGNGAYEYFYIDFDSKKDMFFLQSDDSSDSSDQWVEEMRSVFSYPVTDGLYAAEKTIKLLGRPEEDANFDGYRDVYANREMIDFWVWAFEQISGAGNRKDAEKVFYDEVIYPELEHKLDLIGFDVTQGYGLFELDFLRSVLFEGYLDFPKRYGLTDYEFIPGHGLLITGTGVLNPKIQLSQYYNGNEFSLKQCAADLGFDPDSFRANSYEEIEYTFFNIAYPRSDSSHLGVEYFRGPLDDGTQHFLILHPVPEGQIFPFENIELFVLRLDFTRGNIKINGTDTDWIDGFSEDDINRIVWFLEAVKEIKPGEEEEILQYKGMFESILNDYTMSISYRYDY